MPSVYPGVGNTRKITQGKHDCVQVTFYCLTVGLELHAEHRHVGNAGRSDTYPSMSWLLRDCLLYRVSHESSGYGYQGRRSQPTCGTMQSLQRPLKAEIRVRGQEERKEKEEMWLVGKRWVRRAHWEAEVSSRNYEGMKSITSIFSPSITEANMWRLWYDGSPTSRFSGRS